MQAEKKQRRPRKREMAEQVVAAAHGPKYTVQAIGPLWYVGCYSLAGHFNKVMHHTDEQSARADADLRNTQTAAVLAHAPEAVPTEVLANTTSVDELIERITPVAELNRRKREKNGAPTPRTISMDLLTTERLLVLQAEISRLRRKSITVSSTIRHLIHDAWIAFALEDQPIRVHLPDIHGE